MIPKVINRLPVSYDSFISALYAYANGIFSLKIRELLFLISQVYLKTDTIP
jgi:hypothetical protein